MKTTTTTAIMPQSHPTQRQTFTTRASASNTTPLAAYLLHLIDTKRTNLCVSADVSTTAELLQVAEEVGDSICVLKTHADIIDDFGDKTIRRLAEISARKKFLVFEDRKFGDIGSMFNKCLNSLEELLHGKDLEVEMVRSRASGRLASLGVQAYRIIGERTTAGDAGRSSLFLWQEC